MNRTHSWSLVLVPLLLCGCHRQAICPGWPDSFVGKFRVSH